jgi:hypothetical protein
LKNGILFFLEITDIGYPNNQNSISYEFYVKEETLEKEVEFKGILRKLKK